MCEIVGSVTRLKKTAKKVARGPVDINRAGGGAFGRERLPRKSDQNISDTDRRGIFPTVGDGAALTGLYFLPPSPSHLK